MVVEKSCSSLLLNVEQHTISRQTSKEPEPGGNGLLVAEPEHKYTSVLCSGHNLVKVPT